MRFSYWFCFQYRCVFAFYVTNIRYRFINSLLKYCYFCSVLKRSTHMIYVLIHDYLNKSCVEVQTNTAQRLSEVYNSSRNVQVRKKSGMTPPITRIVANQRGGKIVLLLTIFFTTVLSTHTLMKHWKFAHLKE